MGGARRDVAGILPYMACIRSLVKDVALASSTHVDAATVCTTLRP